MGCWRRNWLSQAFDRDVFVWLGLFHRSARRGHRVAAEAKGHPASDLGRTVNVLPASSFL
jgi:hypothetical protein